MRINEENEGSEELNEGNKEAAVASIRVLKGVNLIIRSDHNAFNIIITAVEGIKGMTAAAVPLEKAASVAPVTNQVNSNKQKNPLFVHKCQAI